MASDLWYNQIVGRSLRVVALLLVSTIASVRVGAVGCEILCLAASNSQLPRSSPEAHGAAIGCHDATAAVAPESTSVAAHPVHERCGHDAAALPTILTSKVQLCTVLHGAETAPNPSVASVRLRVSLQRLREHTPPDLHLPPAVHLRI